jgi:hypothetical protein
MAGFARDRLADDPDPQQTLVRTDPNPGAIRNTGQTPAFIS